MTATPSQTTLAPVLVPLQDIEFVPRVPFVLHNVSWEQYDAIAAELAATRQLRLVYYQGTLELMSSLPLHECPHRMIAHPVVA